MLYRDIDIDKPASRQYEMTYPGRCRYPSCWDGGGCGERGMGSSLMMPNNAGFGRWLVSPSEGQHDLGQHELQDAYLRSDSVCYHTPARDDNTRHVSGWPDLQGVVITAKAAQNGLSGEFAAQRQTHEGGYLWLPDSDLGHRCAMGGHGPQPPMAPAGIGATTKAQLVADPQTTCRSDPLRHAVFQHSHGRETVPATLNGPSAARGSR